MNVLILIVTAISVSADSFFLGLSLLLKSKNYFSTVSAIAVSVFILCFLGATLGEVFGEYLKNYAQVTSGLILFIVGISEIFFNKKTDNKLENSSFKKSFFLGLSVGLDGAVGSFSLACLGYNGPFVAILITIVHVLLLIVAQSISKLLKNVKISDKIPPLILACLGIYKLFF